MGGGGVIPYIYSIPHPREINTMLFGVGRGIITSPSSRFTFIIPYIPNPPHPSSSIML